MNQYFEKIVDGKILDQQEARQLMLDIVYEVFVEDEVKQILLMFNKRMPTVEEFLGFRNALLEVAIPVTFDCPTLDMCGTGGDGKNTFNISTIAAFVCAGAGIKIAKHGNYAVSSISGSSNVLEILGLNFTNNQTLLSKGMNEANIAILHAPLFHPAMKSVAPIRKALGVKTIFNLLGPLVNPAKPAFQVTGVYSQQVGELYCELLKNTTTNFQIIYSQDGYDAISLTSNVDVWDKEKKAELPLMSFTNTKLHHAQLSSGQTKEEAADIFINILNGKGTPAQNSVVIANAAQAISFYEKSSIENAIKKAINSLETGKALKSFEQLVQIYNTK